MAGGYAFRLLIAAVGALSVWPPALADAPPPTLEAPGTGPTSPRFKAHALELSHALTFLAKEAGQSFVGRSDTMRERRSVDLRFPEGQAGWAFTKVVELAGLTGVGKGGVLLMVPEGEVEALETYRAPKPRGGLLSLTLRDTPLQELSTFLGYELGVIAGVPAWLAGPPTLTLHAENVRASVLVSHVARVAGLEWRCVARTLCAMVPPETSERGRLVPRGALRKQVRFHGFEVPLSHLGALLKAAFPDLQIADSREDATFTLGGEGLLLGLGTGGPEAPSVRVAELLAMAALLTGSEVAAGAEGVSFKGGRASPARRQAGPRSLAAVMQVGKAAYALTGDGKVLRPGDALSGCRVEAIEARRVALICPPPGTGAEAEPETVVLHLGASLPDRDQARTGPLTVGAGDAGADNPDDVLGFGGPLERVQPSALVVSGLLLSTRSPRALVEVGEHMFVLVKGSPVGSGRVVAIGPEGITIDAGIDIHLPLGRGPRKAP